MCWSVFRPITCCPGDEQKPLFVGLFVRVDPSTSPVVYLLVEFGVYKLPLLAANGQSPHRRACFLGEHFPGALFHCVCVVVGEVGLHLEEVCVVVAPVLQNINAIKATYPFKESTVLHM